MSSKKRLSGTEVIISQVLQIGVIFSSAIIFVGLILFLTQLHNPNQSYRSLVGQSYSFNSHLPGILQAARAGRGSGLIELGAFLLILTPIFRVGASILIFAHQKDKPMTRVTLFVFLILITSFAVGLLAR